MPPQKGSEDDRRRRWLEYLREDSWAWKKGQLEEIIIDICITVSSLKKEMNTCFFSGLGCKQWLFEEADLKQITAMFKKKKLWNSQLHVVKAKNLKVLKTVSDSHKG